jgi:oxygen-independent coproporphyrinogen-3 oxidase
MTQSELATSGGDPLRTEVGSVFVSNYPPYSAWSAEERSHVRQVLERAPAADTPLGLYLHIPFCRKRCKFCYFKVYTEKTGAEVARYLAALAREVELLAQSRAVRGRPLQFVYVGGGTPSFISVRQLTALVTRLGAALPWTGAREVTFECEPGTLTRPKLEAIRDIGVTRLSLGVESFDDRVLEENGRAHVSKEIYRVVPWIRSVGFEQLNIDLIAGMVGESWDTWKETVRRTLELDPDSVTIYQLELPYNTVYSQGILDGRREVPVAGWPEKRAWQAHAIERLEAAGYEVSSAYTMAKRGRSAGFVYRDALWHGADLLGAGVASFSHVGGVHYQNESRWEPYLARLESGELALDRALVTTPRERCTRELILQLKLGRVEPPYFAKKFGVDILSEFRPALERLAGREMLSWSGDAVKLTREGLLRVDSLLPEFYDPKYRGARYT